MKKLEEATKEAKDWIAKAFGKEEGYEEQSWEECKDELYAEMKKHGVSKDEAEKWIQKAIKHPGALTKEFPGMAKDKDEFTNAELDKIAKKGGVDAKRANLAKTLKSFKHEFNNEN